VEEAFVQKIAFDQVTKQFSKHGHDVTAISELDLEVSDGEFLAIVGPSGCGKSTLLNMAAGLMKPTTGLVSYDGAPLSGVNTKIGYVTQRDNLLPWRSVRDNIAIALEIQRRKRSVRVALVDDIIKQVGLGGFEDHYPAELSGGMRKRVTLARTLIYEPETLAMDEPFGALDSQLKQILQEELLKIWSLSRKTVMFVTHDLEEAITLADRVVAISARPGKIRAVIDIDLPRPRDVFQVRFSKRFAELHEQLWSTLQSDVRAGTEV
jgi:NitT/TauT family transport system ATP-binding protein